MGVFYRHDSVLKQVIVVTRYLIRTAELVRITLRQGNGDYFAPTQTDPEASELDQLQHPTGEAGNVQPRPEDVVWNQHGLGYNGHYPLDVIMVPASDMP